MRASNILLIITATTAALMAGLFFSYSISVSLGLGKLNDKEFLNAMQNINREIQNIPFFICFFGTLIMLPITSFVYYKKQSFLLLFMATLFYSVGVFAVTAFINVPLNNKLELFELANATNASAKQMRNIFEDRWNFWNDIRSLSSLCSVFFIILACVYNGDKLRRN
ncbi:anthrone oxygenase family protein [Flavobacterium sp. UW10123]|uniref:anthrone oxygenase family protein n=1 Tax=Flavobacterium sp. UW10123 TaxID=3230800 RepID=UPI003392EA08